MRLTSLAFCLAISLPAAAQDQLIRQVIESQIEAFQADDFAQAFSFASPNIKALFGTPETFGLMVRDSYPMVYRPSDVEMLGLREVAGKLWQGVRVVDQAGAVWFVDYMMVETPEGWQINAVQIQHAPDIRV